MKKLKTNTDAAPNAAIPIEAPLAAPALKKVSFAGFATQTPGTKASKAYPLLPDPDGQVSELVKSILEKSAQLDALEGALELLCGTPHNASYVESSVMWS
ncbi:MAG: hypothetical protein QOE70_5377 [Chthoniobacter sp.]|nr:hypothetical protein [Chthoniobacter sp.]